MWVLNGNWVSILHLFRCCLMRPFPLGSFVSLDGGRGTPPATTWCVECESATIKFIADISVREKVLNIRAEQDRKGRIEGGQWNGRASNRSINGSGCHSFPFHSADARHRCFMFQRRVRVVTTSVGVGVRVRWEEPWNGNLIFGKWQAGNNCVSGAKINENEHFATNAFEVIAISSSGTTAVNEGPECSLWLVCTC